MCTWQLKSSKPTIFKHKSFRINRSIEYFHNHSITESTHIVHVINTRSQHTHTHQPRNICVRGTRENKRSAMDHWERRDLPQNHPARFYGKRSPGARTISERPRSKRARLKLHGSRTRAVEASRYDVAHRPPSGVWRSRVHKAQLCKLTSVQKKRHRCCNFT